MISRDLLKTLGWPDTLIEAAEEVAASVRVVPGAISGCVLQVPLETGVVDGSSIGLADEPTVSVDSTILHLPQINN